MASSSPVRASSVWVEMPFMHGPKGAERLRELLPILREIRARNAARRERVLAYEWAQKRLCLILGISDARHWNGYVPEARDAEGKPNPWENRRALIDLLRDVAMEDQKAISEPVGVAG